MKSLQRSSRNLSHWRYADTRSSMHRLPQYRARQLGVPSKRWTDSPEPRPSPSSYPMGKHMHRFICACSRNPRRSAPCSVSFSSPMRSWVRSFVLAPWMLTFLADHDERNPLLPDLPYHPLMRCATTLFRDRTSMSHCYSGR